MWTQFWDMHSGGGSKEKWEKIYIEAPENEAKVIFYNRFGHDPDRVTCTCCGNDYSISTNKSLAQLSGYHRNCAMKDGKYVEKPDRTYKNTKDLISVKDYTKQENVCVISNKDIKPEERVGEVRRSGYVWVD